MGRIRAANPTRVRVVEIRLFGDRTDEHLPRETGPGGRQLTKSGGKPFVRLLCYGEGSANLLQIVGAINPLRTLDGRPHMGRLESVLLWALLLLAGIVASMLVATAAPARAAVCSRPSWALRVRAP